MTYLERQQIARKHWWDHKRSYCRRCGITDQEWVDKGKPVCEGRR